MNPQEVTTWGGRDLDGRGSAGQDLTGLVKLKSETFITIFMLLFL